MKNTLFITDTPPGAKSGGGTNGNMHCRMINSIMDLNVYMIYITNHPVEVDQHIVRVNDSTKFEKMVAVMHGYPPYMNKKAVNTIINTIQERKITIVYIDNSISGQLIKKIKQRFDNVSIISFFHDIEIVKMKEDKDVSFLRKIVLPTIYKNEQLTVDYADRTIVLNERDKKLFEKAYKKSPDAIVPISIPEIENLPTDKLHHSNGKMKILFVGVEYGPNLSGVRWFLKEVLPHISCDFVFDIVGFNMEKYRSEFENYSEKVHVIGTVDSLKEWYINADLIVAPIFEGGGMKVKTAEALSYGKRFVGCTESLEGYWEGMPEKLRNTKIFRCNEPKQFAHIINETANKEFCIIDKEIKEWADSQYSYKANYQKYKAIFDSI